MFCEKCGNQITDGEKFCQKCGAPVPGQAPAPEQVQQAAQQAPEQAQQAAQQAPQQVQEPGQGGGAEGEDKAENQADPEALGLPHPVEIHFKEIRHGVPLLSCEDNSPPGTRNAR